VESGVDADTDLLLLHGGQAALGTASGDVDGIIGAGGTNLVAIELNSNVGSSEESCWQSRVPEAESSGSSGFSPQSRVIPEGIGSSSNNAGCDKGGCCGSHTDGKLVGIGVCNRLGNRVLVEVGITSS